MYSIEEVLQETEKKMKLAIEAMLSDFASYRTGRANPLVLKRVVVDYYGTEAPISQVATITVPEPRQILISPYEKSMLGAIEKAIVISDIGVSPNNDGTCIRLNFPPMTEERRKELVKQANARAEQACVAIRGVRQEAMEKAKAAEKNKEATEDDLKSHKDQIQKLTDKQIDETHKLQKKKEEELMDV